MQISRSALLPFTAAFSLVFGVVAAHADAPSSKEQVKRLDGIMIGAMNSDWAFKRLAFLTDKIGPRLSGSLQAAAAVEYLAESLKRIGLPVMLQPVKVPHWVRGEERGELVQYSGQPPGVTQHLHLTALGGSAATPANGLTLPVVVLHNLAEIDEAGSDLKGKIVLISVPFDQLLAENGRAGTAYGQGGAPRFVGPAKLAKYGVAAALVRSVGGANFRLTHTGATIWDEGKPRIPAAAVSVEDALLIERLAEEGPVKMKLTLTPQTLPDVDSYNVITEIRGSEKPDEVVIVSGHLDSWDLGTGAIDDGAGVISALAAVYVLHQLGYQPRRTIRAIAWMNEENGTRGGKAYFDANKDKLDTQFAAIESDAGAGRPLGIMANVTPDSMKLLDPLLEVLRPIGATAFEHREDAIGADITLLQKAGVPGFEPLLDTRDYFNYHHTAADTLDKVDPENLHRQVALLTALAYFLADMPGLLPRIPPGKGD